VTTAAAPRSARTAVRLGSWLSVRRQRRPSPPRRGALSTKARFRGPLVAQTSIERLAQPCGAGLTPRSKGPANEAVQRSSSPSVVVPDSACHAGGRGFESRRSRQNPCKSAPVVACGGANDRRPHVIPRRSRTKIQFCSAFSFAPGTGHGFHPAQIPHALRAHRAITLGKYQPHTEPIWMAEGMRRRRRNSPPQDQGRPPGLSGRRGSLSRLVVPLANGFADIGAQLSHAESSFRASGMT
jgi:hypothetical protein